MDSPAYKLAKHLNTILNKILQLPNAYNVQNTSTLAHSLKLIEINNDIQICSFDIENMHTNVPINELLNLRLLLFIVILYFILMYTCIVENLTLHCII
jgi:hypothetical protein